MVFKTGLSTVTLQAGSARTFHCLKKIKGKRFIASFISAIPRTQVFLDLKMHHFQEGYVLFASSVQFRPVFFVDSQITQQLQPIKSYFDMRQSSFWRESLDLDVREDLVIRMLFRRMILWIRRASVSCSPILLSFRAVCVGRAGRIASRRGARCTAPPPGA